MKCLTRLTMAALLAAWLPTAARAQKEALGVDSIKPTPSLAETFARTSKGLSLRRVTEAMDGQLIDRLNASRKFQIVSRSDLKQLVKEQELANSGNVDAGDPAAAKQFKLAGAKYSLVTTLDDFEDQTQKLEQKIAGKILTRRDVRLGVVAKIYDSTTGKLLESASHLLKTNDASQQFVEAANNAEATDELLRHITREMAEWVATRVANVVFPVKVIAKTDKQVTINRGEGTGVAVDQVWRVFAVGRELIDPDTKEVLGKEEVLVGKVKITDVLPKFSKGEVLEDLGIEAGAVLRLPPPGKAP